VPKGRGVFFFIKKTIFYKIYKNHLLFIYFKNAFKMLFFICATGFCKLNLQKTIYKTKGKIMQKKRTKKSVKGAISRILFHFTISKLLEKTIFQSN